MGGAKKFFKGIGSLFSTKVEKEPDPSDDIARAAEKARRRSLIQNRRGFTRRDTVLDKLGDTGFTPETEKSSLLGGGG